MLWPMRAAAAPTAAGGGASGFCCPNEMIWTPEIEPRASLLSACAASRARLSDERMRCAGAAAPKRLPPLPRLVKSPPPTSAPASSGGRLLGSSLGVRCTTAVG